MLQKWGTLALYVDLLLAIVLSVVLLFFTGNTVPVNSAHFYAATFSQTAVPSVAHAGDANPTQTIALASFVTGQPQSIAVVSSFSVSAPGLPVVEKTPAALLDCMLLLDNDAIASVHDSWNTAPQNQDIVLAGIATFQKGLHALQLSCHVYNGATGSAVLVLTSMGTTITVD